VSLTVVDGGGLWPVHTYDADVRDSIVADRSRQMSCLGVVGENWPILGGLTLTSKQPNRISVASSDLLKPWRLFVSQTNLWQSCREMNVCDVIVAPESAS